MRIQNLAKILILDTHIQRTVRCVVFFLSYHFYNYHQLTSFLLLSNKEKIHACTNDAQCKFELKLNLHSRSSYKHGFFLFYGAAAGLQRIELTILAIQQLFYVIENVFQGYTI